MGLNINGMSRNGWKWIEIRGNDWKMWKWLEMAGKWLANAGNGMAGNGRKRLETAGNGWEWLEWQEVTETAKKECKLLKIAGMAETAWIKMCLLFLPVSFRFFPVFLVASFFFLFLQNHFCLFLFLLVSSHIFVFVLDCSWFFCGIS